MTAASTRFFCLLPQAAAELGQLGRLLRAADVLLHQVDLRRRHVELGLAVELQVQVLFDLPVLLQQLHAAIAGDAVADVDDEIAFAQVEEAVDGPAQPAPAAAGRCTSARRNSSPLLEQHDAVGHQPEAALQRADGKVQAAVAGKLRAAEDLAQAADFGLGLADDEHLLAAAGVVQLVADLVDDAPLNRSTDSIGSRQVVSSEPVAMAEAVTEGNCDRLADHVGHAVKSLRPVEAFEVLPAFAFQLARLDQQEPALRRQVIGQVRRSASGRGAGSERRFAPVASRLRAARPRPPPSPRSTPAAPGSADWPPRTAGSTRSRRRTARSAPAGTSRGQRCR